MATRAIQNYTRELLNETTTAGDGGGIPCPECNAASNSAYQSSGSMTNRAGWWENPSLYNQNWDKMTDDERRGRQDQLNALLAANTARSQALQQQMGRPAAERMAGDEMLALAQRVGSGGQGAIQRLQDRGAALRTTFDGAAGVDVANRLYGVKGEDGYVSNPAGEYGRFYDQGDKGSFARARNTFLNSYRRAANAYNVRYPSGDAD